MYPSMLITAPYLKQCSQSAPDFNQCMINNAEALVPEILNGKFRLCFTVQTSFRLTLFDFTFGLINAKTIRISLDV